MGLWIEKRYPQVISQFNTPHVTFKLKDFKRGWFNSSAHIELTFHSVETGLSEDALPLAQVVVTQDIQHGPLVREKTPGGFKHFVFARAAMENSSHSDNLNFNANTLWTMANSLNTDLKVQHLLFSNERQRVELSQLNGRIDFTPSDQHFQTALTLEKGALYESNPERAGNVVDLIKVMELNNFTTQLNISKIESLWYGQRHFAAQKLIILPYGGEALTLENIAFGLNQNQNGPLTDFNLINKTENISGGAYKISQLSINLILKDINSALLDKFAHVFIYGSDFQRLRLYSLLVDLLTKGMSINLSELKFNTDEGPVNIQAAISASAVNETDSSFSHLMDNLNIQAAANVPKEWLRKNLISYYNDKTTAHNSKADSAIIAQNYMDHWLAHHLLISDNQQVGLKIEYKEGNLLINGEKPALSNFVVNEN